MIRLSVQNLQNILNLLVTLFHTVRRATGTGIAERRRKDRFHVQHIRRKHGKCKRELIVDLIKSISIKNRVYIF